MAMLAGGGGATRRVRPRRGEEQPSRRRRRQDVDDDEDDVIEVVDTPGPLIEELASDEEVASDEEAAAQATAPASRLATALPKKMPTRRPKPKPRVPPQARLMSRPWPRQCECLQQQPQHPTAASSSDPWHACSGGGGGGGGGGGAQTGDAQGAAPPLEEVGEGGERGGQGAKGDVLGGDPQTGPRAGRDGEKENKIKEGGWQRVFCLGMTSPLRASVFVCKVIAAVQAIQFQFPVQWPISSRQGGRKVMSNKREKILEASDHGSNHAFARRRRLARA